MRAAAKNFDHVMVISDPKDYIELKKELKISEVALDEKPERFLLGKHFLKLLITIT